MTAVWMRFRAELRGRWLPWLGLALLVGLAGGLVVGFVAGARRTDSSYSRFLDAQNAADVVVYNYPDEGTAVFDFDDVAQLPQVTDSARADADYLSLGGGHPAVAPLDKRLGTEINKLEILEGRAADPDAPGEAVVPFTVAEDFDLEIGDRLALYFSSDDLAASIPPAERTEEERQFIGYLRQVEAALPGGTFEVVGVEASPGEFPPQFAAGTPVHLTPAFAEVTRVPAGELLAVQLRNGAADVAAFRAELEARSQGKPIEMDVQADLTRATERSIHQQAVALWILAGLTALVGALIVGQLLVRLTLLEAASDDILSALGMSRRQRFVLALARAALVGAAGAVGAVGVGILISPFMPTGLARIAEPDPGLTVDGLAVMLGVVTVAAAVVLLAAWPAWRASQTLGERSAPSRIAAPSRLVEALARAGASASATIGVRMAVDPGQGRRAVPVRTTLAVVTLGVAVLTAALVFGTSLRHLLDTPRLYGTTWDVRVTNYGSGPSLETEGVAAAEAVDGIAGFSVGELFIPLRVNGEQVNGLALDPVEGDVEPPVFDGRPPVTRDEIVLGERTREDLGLEVGDRVDVQVSGSDEERSLLVVGTGVIPSFGESADLGEGALLTVKGVRQFTDPPEDGYALFLDLEPGASEDAVVAALQERLDVQCAAEPTACELGPGFLTAVDDATPTDIANFGRVRNMPLVVGGVLGLLAAGTLAHLLFSAVRRRGRDLALLKALGFERRQCVSTVAWQANTIVGVGLLVGLPVGLVIGRLIWTTFAEGLGVLSEPRTPLIAALLTVVGALVLANVIALIPAWAAAKARPADALRAE